MTSLSLDSISVGALQNIRLEVLPEEVVCLSGPSGCGKSRLLRSIADLEPHCGTVHLGERDQGAVPGHHWRRSVMMVPAESAWWFNTVGEHLGSDVQNNTTDLLRALGFPDDTTSWPVERLSSGEKQRLALVRALCREPEALLLDEPTANLDEENTRKVELCLLKLIRERHLPVIWVAHGEEQIARVADRHFRIEGSRLVEQELRK